MRKKQDGVKMMAAKACNGDQAAKIMSKDADDVMSMADFLTMEKIAGMTKDEKKKLFLQTGGKIDIDEEAFLALRERSMA